MNIAMKARIAVFPAMKRNYTRRRWIIRKAQAPLAAQHTCTLRVPIVKQIFDVTHHVNTNHAICAVEWQTDAHVDVATPDSTPGRMQGFVTKRRWMGRGLP